MNSLTIIALLTLTFVSYGTGWLVRDYKQFSREYDAYEYAQARRRALRAIKGDAA